eukprot:scaffold8.g1694.t1
MADSALPLHRAAARGDVDGMRLALASAPGVATAVDVAGRRALHVAAAHGHAAAVALLLAAGEPGSETTRCKSGFQPVHYASHGGHVAALEALLEAAPGTAAAPTRGGSTPLHLAAAAGRGEAAALLLARAPEAAASTNMPGCAPLHLAAKLGHASIIELLLDAAPGIERAVDRAGSSALALATATGHLAAARAVLARSTVPAAELIADLLGAMHDPHASQRTRETVSTLLADLVARRALSPADWAVLPTPCPGLARTLPDVLARSPAEAVQLVAHLPDTACGRLRTLALSLARVQRRLGWELPEAVLRCILVAAPLED